MTTSIDRLIEIESERQKTMSDPGFRQWMEEIGVSRIYRNPEPIHRARDLNAEYNFSKLFDKRNIFSIFNIINN